MILAANQPCFMPWMGYFDLICQSDVWISLDTFQFPNRSFINRNRICPADGNWKWITVSTTHIHKRCSILNVKLASSEWYTDISAKLDAYYRKSSFFSEVHKHICAILVPREDSLATYNERTVKDLCAMMDIKFNPIPLSSLGMKDYDNADSLFVDLCKKFGASDYYNFQRGVEIGLHKPENFLPYGIRLVKQEFQHPVYPQLTPDFISHLSILDALYNVGPERSRELVLEGSRWVEVSA